MRGGILVAGNPTTGGQNGDLDHRRRAARDVHRDALRKGATARRRWLRRRPADPQRPDRPSARRHRVLPRDGGRRGCSRARAVERPRGLRSRRRPQRRRPSGGGRRTDDRPVGDDGDPRRPGGTHAARPGRRDVASAQSRGARTRPRRDRRRDLDDRDCRLHARRRAGVADGQARPRVRQPDRRRARDGRRHDAERHRRQPSGSDVGAARRRRQLRHRRVARLPPTSGRHGHGRPDRASDRRRRRHAPLLPGRGRRLPGRPDGVRGGRPRAGRIGDEDRRHGGVPHRRSRPGGARPRTVQELGLAADGRGRADALPGDEHAPRRRVPGRARSTTGCRASRPACPTR